MPMAQDLIALYEGLGLGTYDEANGGTLFLDGMPATPDVCAVVSASGGAPATGAFGHVGIKYESPTCQVRFRGVKDDRLGPALRARTAYDGSYGVGVTLSGTKYLRLFPLQPPFPFEQDSKGRFVYAFNVFGEKEP